MANGIDKNTQVYRALNLDINVVWLKRDLRISDNHALMDSLESGLTLLYYAFEPILIDDPHYDKRHWRFVWQSIQDINIQLEKFNTDSILNDSSKNVICDDNIKGIKVRFQRVYDLPTKELRKLTDKGKKELGEGIVIIFSSLDKKVGLAIGVTEGLTIRYNAVDFVKMGSEIVGGSGGGGRPDFAQAGGVEEDNINDAFNKLISLI